MKNVAVLLESSLGSCGRMEDLDFVPENALRNPGLFVETNQLLGLVAQLPTEEKDGYKRD